MMNKKPFEPSRSTQNRLTNDALDTFEELKKIFEGDTVMCIRKANNLDAKFSCNSIMMSNDFENITKLLYEVMKENTKVRNVIHAAFVYDLVNLDKEHQKNLIEFIKRKLNDK